MNKKEYNEVVETYSKNIYRFLSKSVKDSDAVKDIMQESFLKLWQHREKVEVQKAKSWLFTTAYRFMLKYIQHKKISVSLDEAGDMEAFSDPATGPAHGFDTKEILDKCIDTLPAVQKNILLLRDLEGYNYKEIGDMLELSEEQVKVYLFRARQKMKSKIQSMKALL